MNIDELYERVRKGILERAVTFPADKQIVSNTGYVYDRGWLLDFRNLLMNAEYLELVAELFWQKYEDKYPFQVGGQETAAIPLISAIILKGAAIGKAVNGFYVRKSRKKTGLQKTIEGTVTNEPIILIDDILNSGNTQIRTLTILENEGYTNVSDLFVITQFHDDTSYGTLHERNITISSLFRPKDFDLTFEQPKPYPTKSGFEILWKFESHDPNLFYVVPKSAPVLDEEKIYFGSDNGTFWALDQATGTTAWKFKIWRKAAEKAIFSSPALHEKTVYFGAYDGNVYALNTDDGLKRWSYWEADWVGSSPALAPDLNLLFIGLEFGLPHRRGGIVALDMETGDKRWEAFMPGLTHASPAYSQAHNMVGIGCNDGVFRMYRADTGELLWERSTGGDIKYTPHFDEARERVLFGSFDGKLYACDMRTGEVIHTFQTESEIYSTPLLSGDTIYLTSTDKRVYALDADTLTKRWQYDTWGRLFSSPVIVNDSVLIGSNDGFLYELSPDGALLDFFSSGERIVNAIAYAQQSGIYYVPTHKNELYALQKKQSI